MASLMEMQFIHSLKKSSEDRSSEVCVLFRLIQAFNISDQSPEFTFLLSLVKRLAGTFSKNMIVSHFKFVADLI